MTQLNTISRFTVLEILGLFFGSLVLFTWGLDGREIIGFDSRFYLFAQEMWRNGLSWFPTAYQQPYPDYPATSTALIYVSSLLFGQLNKFTAVLPSAIAASITVVLTYLIGSLQSKRWGWYAVLFLILTLAFLKNARSISLDMYTCMLTAACFYLVYSADIKNKPQRIMWLYPLLFLAFAFRGPIGLVMPTGVVCAYYLLDGQVKRLLTVGFSALGLLVFCTALLLAIAYSIGGMDFLEYVLRMEVLGRMEKSVVPRYFYLVDGMANYALSFPLAWLVMLGVVYYLVTTRKLSAEKKLLIKLFGWMVVILVGMSIPGDKKIRYVLAMSPAIALMAAYPFVAPCKQKYFVYLRRFLLSVLSLLPLILLLAVMFILPYGNKYAITVALPYWPMIIALGALQVFCFFCVYYYANRLATLAGFILLIAALSVALIHIFMVEPIELYIDRARDFVQQVETERSEAGASLVFYKERPDSMPIKYLINMPQAEQPLFLDTVESLQQFSRPAYFVTSAAYFAALPAQVVTKYRIIAKDTLGHVKVVVFTQR